MAGGALAAAGCGGHGATPGKLAQTRLAFTPTARAPRAAGDTLRVGDAVLDCSHGKRIVIDGRPDRDPGAPTCKDAWGIARHGSTDVLVTAASAAGAVSASAYAPHGHRLVRVAAGTIRGPHLDVLVDVRYDGTPKLRLVAGPFSDSLSTDSRRITTEAATLTTARIKDFDGSAIAIKSDFAGTVWALGLHTTRRSLCDENCETGHFVVLGQAAPRAREVRRDPLGSQPGLWAIGKDAYEFTGTHLIAFTAEHRGGANIPLPCGAPDELAVDVDASAYVTCGHRRLRARLPSSGDSSVSAAGLHIGH
jgi:hypothetical protein